jgi:hypothetical protein
MPICGSGQYDKAKALRDEAVRLYLRARGYCWRALEVRFAKGITDRLKADPVAALSRAKKDDVPLLYWSAASLGAAISLASSWWSAAGISSAARRLRRAIRPRSLVSFDQR